MEQLINVWIVSREGEISDMQQASEFNIAVDYVASDDTYFYLSDIEFNQGDFVFAKRPNGEGNLFFGVIDSYENEKIVCTDILSLLDFEFPATRFSGNSFEQHAKNLINRYLIQDTNKLMDILDITVKTNTKHIYQPAEPPTPTSLMKYLINGFKKYNVVWRFDEFKNGRIKTSIENISDTMQLKNNLVKLVDWEISTTEVGKGIENHLMIVNKNTTNSEGPNILSEWWLTKDNEVTTNSSDEEIVRPSKTKVWIYDMNEEDKPAYSDIANSELKGSYYAHELTFKMPLENDIICFDELKIGTLANIVYNDKVYQSVLSGYELGTDSEYIEVRFGHIRSRLSELLE